MSKISRFLVISVISLFLIISIFSFAAAVSAPSQKCDTIFCFISDFFSSLFSGKLTGQTVLTQTEQSNCPNGLIAYWNFDDGSGSVAYDAFNASNGNLVNGPAWTTDAVAGKALDFDGIDDYVNAGNSNIFNFGANDWTISFWAKPETLGQYDHVISKSNSGTVGPYAIWTGTAANNKWALLAASVDAWDIAYEWKFADVNVNSWQQVIVTRNGGTIDFYVNGTKSNSPVNAGTSPLLANNENFLIGKINYDDNPSFNTVFDGKIDEVAVFSRGFSQSDVDLIYGKGQQHQGICEAAQPSACPSELGAYWQMDEGAGTTISDSADGNTGTLNGAVSWAPGIGGAGSALSLNGGYASIPSSSSINPSGLISLAAWVKTGNSGGTWQIIMEKANWNDYSYYVLHTVQGSQVARFALSGLSPAYVDGTTNLADNQWHYVVGTWDGSQLKIYVDGDLENSLSSSGTRTTNSNPLLIGTRAPEGGPLPFYGSIDDAAVYSKALTIDEIRTNYNSGSWRDLCEAAPPAPTCPASMVSYWKGENNANDEKGLNNGVWQTAPSYTNGKLGQAFSFSGGNSDIITSVNGLTNLNTASVCFWVQYNSQDQATSYLGQESVFAFSSNFVSGDDRSTELIGTWFNPIFADSIYIAGTPYFTCGVYDGSKFSMYVDGVKQQQENSYTAPMWNQLGGTPLTALHIGTARPNYGLNGWLDEIAVFNRALTESEISQYYNGGAGKDYCAAAQALPVVAINSGNTVGGPWTDALTRVTFNNDQYWVQGTGVVPLGAWGTDPVWSVCRYGPTVEYNIPVPTGKPYIVHVGIKEAPEGGDRYYNLYVENTLIESVSGHPAGFQKIWNVSLPSSSSSDGYINVNCVETDGDPNCIISAIWIEEAAPACGDGDTQGMVSYWKADGDASDSKDANHGTFAGNANANGEAKVGTGSFSFDGYQDYVQLGQGSLNLVGPMTVEMWVKPSSARQNNYQSLYGRYSGVGTNQHQYQYVMVDSNQFVYYNLVDNNVRMDGGVDYDQWQHVAFTYDGSSVLTLYKNGVSTVFNNVIAPASQPNYFSYLGASWCCPDNYWYDGLIDEVAIYDRALTADEIAAHIARSNDNKAYCPYGGAPAVEICDNQIDDDGDSLIDCLDSDCASNPACQQVACGAVGSDTEGMVSYWKMDETAGNIIDAYGANNGTNHGADYSQTGKVNTSLGFVAANNDYIELNDAGFDWLNYNAPWSFAFWMYIPATGTQPVGEVFNKGIGSGGTSGFGISLHGNGANRYWYIWQKGENGQYHNMYYPQYFDADSGWVHVVLTYNGAGVMTYENYLLYKNGELLGSPTYEYSNGVPDTLANNYVATIGKLTFMDWMTAKLDEYAIFNRTLSAAEISSLYNLSSGGSPYCGGGAGPVCGDGTVDAGEECDDGNNVDCDGCKSDCSRADNVCGDSVVECSEQCDPPGTGCSASCTIESACTNPINLYTDSSTDSKIFCSGGTCTVLDDINFCNVQYYGIAMNDNDLILDCNGHSLTAIGYPGDGIWPLASNNVIKNCIINGFGNGISLVQGGNSATIFNNTISNTDPNGGKGIIIGAPWQASDNNVIKGNTLTSCHRGIAVDGGTNNVITLNTISGSSTEGDIVMGSASSGNKIYYNNFMTEVFQKAVDENGNNQWDDGACAGNYYPGSGPNGWSCVDSGNGICNAPRQIPGSSASDSYPLANAWPTNYDNNVNGIADCGEGGVSLPPCTLDDIFDLDGNGQINVQDIIHLQRWIAWQLLGGQGQAPELINAAKGCELFSVQKNPAVVMSEQSLC